MEKEYSEYPNYIFYSDGTIKSKRFNKLLKPRLDIKNGYSTCALWNKDGIRKELKTHRIISEVFIPNPNAYPIVNHKDGNKINNDISNLEWCTQKQNVIHSIDVLEIRRIHKKIYCIQNGIIYNNPIETSRSLFNNKCYSGGVSNSANSNGELNFKGFNFKYVIEKISAYDLLTNEFLEEFENNHDAEEKTGICSRRIKECLIGLRLYTGKYNRETNEWSASNKNLEGFSKVTFKYN